MPEIFIDADACPVKEETYRVAQRYGLVVHVVSHGYLRLPQAEAIRLVVAGDKFGAVDDWIAEHIQARDVAITADVPLAARCVAEGARVLSPTGREFTEQGIGNALATRDLMTHLRETGVATGGPPAFAKKDRSRFLSELDRIIQALRRA